MGRPARHGGGDDSDDSERIQFLTPRDSVFGGERPADFAGVDTDDLPPPDDIEPRSRWLPAAATLAIVALIGGGLIAASPWDSGDDAGTQPLPTLGGSRTTVDPQKSVDTQTAVDPRTDGNTPGPQQPVTGFVLEPLPAGFTVLQAWSNTSNIDSYDVSPLRGWGEVWATDNASRNAGSWFSLTLLPHRYDESGSPATRVDLGGVIAEVRDEGEGILHVTVPVSHSGAQQTLLVRSFGRSFDDLIELVDSIGVDDDRPGLIDDRPVFVDDSALEGFELIASGATQKDLLDSYVTGVTASSTLYSTPRGLISIDTSPRNDALDPLGRFAVGPVRLFPDTNSVSSSFSGDSLVLGVSPSGSDPDILARWHTDDTTVAVRTTVPLGELLELLPSVRHTTADQWANLQQSVQNVATTSDQGTSGPAVGIGAGLLSDGTEWHLQLRPPDTATMRFGAITAFQLAADPERVISVGSFSAGTLAFATSPTDGGATLRALVDGDVVAESPMTDLGTIDPTSSFAARVGALVFEQAGPFEVQLLDSTGTVLDRYTSPGFQS